MPNAAGGWAALLALLAAQSGPAEARALGRAVLPLAAAAGGPREAAEQPAEQAHERWGLRPHEFAVLGETLLFNALLGCAALAVSLLMVCCLWDVFAKWRHWAHFRACERKVRSANDVFSNRKGELPICPYCVEAIASQPSPTKVVFLCGHRFHTECCNAWFLEAPEAAGRCPICEAAPEEERGGAAGGGEDCAGEGCNDEAQGFILRSLHKQFPEIIPEACLQRWASCHTQIWLSELSCPRYNSVLRKPR